MSAVVDPGCDTADPDGELEAEPLLEIGWLPLLVLFIFDWPHGAEDGDAEGEGMGEVCDCATTGANISVPIAAATTVRRAKCEDFII